VSGNSHLNGTLDGRWKGREEHMNKSGSAQRFSILEFTFPPALREV
jgi:hypothetical protein